MTRLPETLPLPGAVDIHVHLREPGNNLAETIESGTRAALLGGFVAIADMPNTPGRPTWTVNRVHEKRSLISAKAHIPVGVYGGAQPESDNVDEIEGMSPYVIGFKFYSTGTTGNDNEYGASDFKEQTDAIHDADPEKPIMLHASPENLEDMIGMIAVDRGHPLHVCHVNNPDEVDLIQRYKKRGLPLTSGITPHHIFMTSHDVFTRGWFARMKPVLARQSDTEKLFRQLVDGEIDIVETDHAPHPYEEKIDAEEKNPDGCHGKEHKTCYGVPGIEFAIPLLLRQAQLGNIPVSRIIEVTSTKPAEILCITLRTNTRVTWETAEYRIENERRDVLSGSGWTPFLGMLAIGHVREVEVGGKLLVASYDVQPRVKQKAFAGPVVI